MSNVTDKTFNRVALLHFEQVLGDTLGVIVVDNSKLKVTRKGDDVSVIGVCNIQLRKGTFCLLHVEFEASRDHKAVADDKLDDKTATKAFKSGFGDRSKFFLGDKKIRVKESRQLREVHNNNYNEHFKNLPPRVG